MTYEVRYRMKHQWFWRKVKKVKGDLLSPAPVARVLILDDEQRIEVPLKGTEFHFCSNRFLVIKQNMERESGTSIPVPSSGS